MIVISYPDAIDFMQDYPDRYHELNECFRSSVDIDIFRATQCAIIANKDAYRHWIARDPAYIPVTHAHRAEMLRIQREVALNLFESEHDDEYLIHIPSGIVHGEVPMNTAECILAILTATDADIPLGSPQMLAIEALLDKHKITSNRMVPLAMRFPHLIHRMHPDYSRSARCISDVIQNKLDRYLAVMRGLEQEEDARLRLGVTMYFVLLNPEAYTSLPLHCVYSPAERGLSVQIALSAVGRDLRMYAGTPVEVRKLNDKFADLMFTNIVTIEPTLRILFIDNAAPFCMALAMAACRSDPNAYAHIPQHVIREMDLESGHTFSRAVLQVAVGMAAYVPIGSPILDDPELCRRALADRTAAPYVRFPANVRAMPAVVAALKFHPSYVTDARDPCAVFAAVPEDALLNPAMPSEFLQRVQAELACVHAPHPTHVGPKVRLYREMYLFQPLALRLLHEPLFKALTEPYRVTIAGLQRALPGMHELVARIMGLVYGNAFLLRIRKAYFKPDRMLAEMRRAMGVSTIDWRDYRNEVDRGILSLRAEQIERHPDEWFVARHIAEFGAQPEVDLCDTRARCGVCFRCSTLLGKSPEEMMLF